MPKKRALCKFFAQGTCVKGAQCNYSHDRRSQVCKFFQKGMCSYGNHCKFEHVEASRFQNSVSSSSSSNSHAKPASSRMARSQTSGIHTNLGNESGGSSTTAELANQSVCAFAAAGKCPYGENCLQRHGDLCSKRGKHCLNPYRPDERDEHLKRCQRNNKHLEMLRHSQDIECSVCLEQVLSKPTPAQRKFGLLSECDHPFCISCIRNWRSNSSSSGIDVKSAVRACPVCRKVSHFVIPSGTWYSTKEEKQEIIRSYKAKLSSIDCKHFDFGNGICPFGTSCFYKHTCQPDKYPRNTCKQRNVSRDSLDEVFTHVYWPHHFNPCDFVSSDESTDEEDFRDLFDVHRFYDEGVRDLLDGCMFSDGEEDLFFDDHTIYDEYDKDLFFDDDSCFEGSSMMDVACLTMMSGLTVHVSSSDGEY